MKFHFLVRADGGKWMCPTARSRRDIYNEHVKIEKGCKISLEISNVRMSLRNEHFQNAARGPLKYVGPGPSAPHFENVHFKTKVKRAATTCLHRPGQRVYISLVNLFT